MTRNPETFLWPYDVFFQELWVCEDCVIALCGQVYLNIMQVIYNNTCIYVYVHVHVRY